MYQVTLLNNLGTLHIRDGQASKGIGFLAASSSAHLTQTTHLVVLSDCNTQVGELSQGDEIVGLNRAFLYTGTPTVIASLWIDGAATGLLREQFYTHLKTGMKKAEALRQAQIEVRAEYPYPYYWPAFSLTGDGGR